MQLWGQTKQSTLDSNFGKKERIALNDSYLFSQLISKKKQYSVYEGIDISEGKYITVYLRHSTSDNKNYKKVKDDLSSKISPGILWKGNYKSDKATYSVEVHQKYGPTIFAMFQKVKEISHVDFLLLLYQLIKLVQKYTNAGFVHRDLDVKNIVFDPKPEKTQLYLLNTFELNKKNHETPAIATKYCSRGAHLGLKTSVKDDLESLCYIMISIKEKLQFLRHYKSDSYLEAKINMSVPQINNYPLIFVEFFMFVRSIGHSQEFNYFQWKSCILKEIGKEALSKPYKWLVKQQECKEPEIDFQEDRQEMNQVECHSAGMQKLGKSVVKGSVCNRNRQEYTEI